MTGRVRHSRRASTKASHVVARGSEAGEEEEERGTDEEVALKKRDKGKGRAIEVFDSDDEEEEVETSEDDASDWEESRKRTKKAKSAGKKGGKGGGASAAKKGGRKGKDVGRLEVMKTLPLELLVETFSHLDPNDLLALSVVNKQNRSLLTSSGSKKVWENSRKKIDLPDLGTDEITEWQYAQLVFGWDCQKCGTKNVKRLDSYLRKRLCKSCRIQDVVRLSSFDRLFPKLKEKLHPRALDVVRRTPYGETVGGPTRWRKWTFKLRQDGDYASIDDLFMLSRILRDLEAQDEDDAILEGGTSPPPEARVPKPSAWPPTRKTYTSKQWRADDSSDSGDEPVKDWESARVVRLIKDREASLDEFGKVTKHLAEAGQKASEHAVKVERERWIQEYDARRAAHQAKPPPASRHKANPRRQQQITDRVASLGYSAFEVYRLSGKIVTSASDLTDGEWEKIQPKVIEALDRQRKKTAKANEQVGLRSRQVESQKSLRPLFDAFKKSLPASARPFVPLFVDFLVLPPVKELWQAGKKVTSEQWKAQLDGIHEEVDHFRLDLVLHARQLILKATTDPDKAKDGSDTTIDEGDAELDDAFFSRATSLLCCGFPGCPPPSRKHRVWVRDQDSRGPFWGGGRLEWKPTLKDRQGSFGSLVDVLKHMHADHNGGKQLWGTKALKATPQFHLALPLEVACAVSALLELHDLDPETSTKDDLASMSAVFVIKRKGEKLGKLKPPVALDPLCIVLRRFKPNAGEQVRRPAAAKGTEAEKDDSSGNSSSLSSTVSDDDASGMGDEDDERERGREQEEDEDENSEVEQGETSEGGAGMDLQHTTGDNEEDFARYKARFRAADEDSASDEEFE
ncbi:hypothetical protein JCM10296v2_006259 [Rhodotorula toruloides]